MGALEPQGMAYFEVAPIQSTASIECPTPARTVFRVLADHRRWPEWFGMGISAVQPTSELESGIGSTRTLTIGRGALRVQETFIAWEEPTLWAFTAVDCRPRVFRSLVEGFWLEAMDESRTRITYRMGCELPALMSPTSGVFARVWTRTINKALPNLTAETIRRHTASR
jgi:hypothetical protein